MNYIIKDEKKFARICLENFNQQLTLINDNFRIIILVDKKFVDKCELAFLNRLEKMILSFDKLIDTELQRITTNLIEEIKLKKSVHKIRNINYSLKDLLINCGTEEIQGLLYYFSKELKKNDEDNEEQIEKNIDEKALKEKVINKIYKILPQDIICILPENNIIKTKYKQMKKIYNYKDYINEEETKNYKISIIYTFTGVANVVEGLNKDMSFMVSVIRSEDGLKTLIEEIKIKNENNKKKKDYNICIHFERSNFERIKFISNFILNNFKDDKYNYILIIHINRNFNLKKSERIHSLPDINPAINQIFIDNLNGNNNMKLNDLLQKDISDILNEKKEEMKLDEEFNKTLINFVINELNNKVDLDDNNKNEYINEIKTYMNEEGDIKEKIKETTYKLIDDNKDEEGNCKEIIEKIYEMKYINIYTIDIVSYLIDYIKENIFNKYLKKVLEILEDNNILTTLIEIQKNDYKNIHKNLVEEIIMKYLDEITIDKNKIYKSKILFNYNVPGFYNFYTNISDYISKNITSNYLNNETKRRKLKKTDINKIKDFQNKEESLLNIVFSEVEKNNKSITEIINKIPKDLVFKDYITYYLQKYKNSENIIYNKDDIYHKLIEILIKLRFNDENKLIKGNNEVNILLIKVIWLESNVNYILNLFQIVEKSIIIYNNNDNILYNKIDELILKENKIKYIINEKENPECRKEVNECYYILLASICYSIASDEITLYELVDNKNNNELQIQINHYCNKLKEIFKILENLNDDLHIFLIEMFIIDELIKVIELFKKKKNIEKINEVRSLIRENANIIQKYANNSKESFKLSDELNNNFESIYNKIMKDELVDKNDKEYYDKLRYILFKEIRKVSDINYRYKIFEKLLESDEMIKKSNDILELLLDNCFKKDKFEDNMVNLLNGNDNALKLIENKLNDNNFVLAETLFYFFEKNSLIYLKNILGSKNEKNKIINIEDEPLKILEDCIGLLSDYMFKPKLMASKLKEIGKLFCLGYIKTYCYTFIKMFGDKHKYNENPKKIIDIFNGNGPIYKMLRLYIYKILYNNYQIDIFINPEKIKIYKLEKYNDFETLIQNNKELINIYKIADKIKTINDDYYDEAKKVIEKYKKEDFKNPMKIKDFDLEDIGIDNFYAVSYNIALTNLQMDKSDHNKDFYKNICEILFRKGNNQMLLKVIQLFYDPTTYKKIKEDFKINSNNIKALLFGYRFCLNEISSKKGIYYPLYDSSNINYLKEKLYPGNDTKFNKVYSNIINHFKYKPDEGCYVCLCDNGYYHSVPSGFPGIEELDMKCLQCNENIGSYKSGIITKGISIVKRKNYYRIFQDENEIEEIKKDRNKRSKMKEINHLTLQQFKEKYIYKSIKNEKGVYITDEDNFKNDEKVVRNLSQISYRLLNYILYSHLFFARLITTKKEFDKYLPQKMNWVDTLNECWNLLKNELLKENIDSIEKFMYYIFVDLFLKLNKEKDINEFENLIKLEDELESVIQKLIKNFREKSNKANAILQKNDEDYTSFISLLKEKYTSNYYTKEEFPFYEYLYYSDYLNEKYINKKLYHMHESKYPVLKKYLDNKLKKKSENSDNKYSLDNLNLFNKVLNLINEEYFNNISREDAEKKKLKDVEIYINNKELIDNFIRFYNNLKIKDNEGKIELSENNSLFDFFLDEDNRVGRTYKDIYKNFVKEQNKEIEHLLDMKKEKGIFDINCKNKINIQKINENEIYTSKLPANISLIDILFNSSYRKILDSDARSYELYNEFAINYDSIEENMTDLLLKNKKLLNEDISKFIYNKEAFNNQLSNYITLFKNRYNNKNIDIYDKLAVFKFCDANKNNINVFKYIVNDFITLIKFLNNKRKEGTNKDNDITEESKIYVVLDQLKDQVSIYMIKIFEEKDGLTIDKTSEIFGYYLKCIYKDVMNEIKKYQENLDDKSKEIINDYYEKAKEKKNCISKKDFAYAIRMFTSLILLPEEDKENKIKSNRNNLVNYLRTSDLWKSDIYDNEDFSKNLNELKSINAQINQIIDLYVVLGKDIEDDYFDDVKEKIKKENSKNNEDDVGKDNKNIKEVNDKYANKNYSDDDDKYGNKNYSDDDDKYGNKNDSDDDDKYAKKDDSDDDDKYAKKDDSDDE